jgi:hypothetical protein
MDLSNYVEKEIEETNQSIHQLGAYLNSTKVENEIEELKIALYSHNSERGNSCATSESSLAHLGASIDEIKKFGISSLDIGELKDKIDGMTRSFAIFCRRCSRLVSYRPLELLSA